MLHPPCSVGGLGRIPQGADCKHSLKSQGDDSSCSLAGLHEAALDTTGSMSWCFPCPLSFPPLHMPWKQFPPTRHHSRLSPLRVPRGLVSESSLQDFTLQYSPFWRARGCGEDSSKGCRCWCQKCSLCSGSFWDWGPHPPPGSGIGKPGALAPRESDRRKPHTVFLAGRTANSDSTSQILPAFSNSATKRPLAFCFSFCR